MVIDAVAVLAAAGLTLLLPRRRAADAVTRTEPAAQQASAGAVH